MNRRDLFKGIWATIVSALFTPRMAVSKTRTDVVPITLSWMNEVYGTLWWGNMHPTRIEMSEYRMREVLSRFKEKDRREIMELYGGTPQFNDARIVVNRSLSDDLVNFINEKRPSDPRFNLCARIGERIWFDVSGKEHRTMVS